MNERTFATFFELFLSCNVTRGFIVCLAYRNLSSAVVRIKINLTGCVIFQWENICINIDPVANNFTDRWIARVPK